ncbi:MAG TPA: glycosyltransferase [Thermoguttaceae bacterium]|nr:glycosyltransferase [Thermoguttaceae bacterium]
MAISSATLFDETPAAGTGKPALARVLHVINGEHYSGAERVQDLLAAELPSLGFDVALACVKSDLFPKMRRSTTVLYDLRMRGRADLLPIGRLARLVRDEGFSLLHAHTPRTALVAALASKATGVPMVYHVHSPASRDSTRAARNWLNERLERLCLGRAAAVIAVSESLARDTVGRGIDAGKVFVVPNGVPCRTMRPERRPGDPHWTLGTVALFRPRKGTEVLLEALAALRAAGLAAELRAVGGFETPRHEEELKRRAVELGVAEAVHWTGFTRDVDRELREMDLFVLPSLFGEGLPMVVLEAMATGVPVVASRVEGIPETIRDGLDGLLVEPGNAEALADALRRFIDGRADWAAMRRSAATRQAERFSEHAMAVGTAEVYRRVLGLDDLNTEPRP